MYTYPASASTGRSISSGVAGGRSGGEDVGGFEYRACFWRVYVLVNTKRWFPRRN